MSGLHVAVPGTNFFPPFGVFDIPVGSPMYKRNSAIGSGLHVAVPGTNFHPPL